MLAATTLLFGLVGFFVDLKPLVDEKFFFSSGDPEFRQSQKIDQRFPAQPELILTVSSSDISSAHYLRGIQRLTEKVGALDAVSTVKS